MAQITSREELVEWLKDKPADWAQVIAARAALRVLPYAFGEETLQKWVSIYSLALFRATAISWATCNFPTHDMGGAPYAAYAAAEDAFDAARAAADAPFAADPAADAARAGSDAAYAAYAAYAAARAAVDAAARAARADGWTNINHDCDWLSNETDPTLASRLLTREMLWPAGEPEGWSEAWVSAAARLAALDQGYSVWIDWYNRRIHGNRAAFDIPGDSDRTEDKAILARLADATDEDFWDKGATYVNTTLQSWIDEARERVAPPPAQPTDEEAIASELGQPVPHAVPLIYGDDEKLHIDVQAQSQALRDDAAGRKLHGEVGRLARKLGNELTGGRGGNSSSDLAEENALLIERLGVSPSEADPHLLVCSVIAIEVALNTQPNPNEDSNIAPFPDEVLRALKALVPIANIYLSTDPELAAIHQGSTGPGKPLIILASPAEIIAAIRDAEAKGVSGADVTEVLSAMVATAPAEPVAEDAGTQRASREAQSLVRRVTGKVIALGRSVFKNAGSIETVAGWAKGAGKWLYDQRDLVGQVFRDRPDVMEVLKSIWKSMSGS